MRIRQFLLVASVGCALAISGASSQASPLGRASITRATARAIGNIARGTLANNGAGLSIAVERRGRIVFAQGYGFADLDRHIRARSRTVYGIASITKQLTAAAIMQLVQRHKVRLRETLPSLLPGLAWRDPRARRVTLRQLLNHTSGIPGYETDPAYPTLSGFDKSKRKILGLITPRTLLFDPGTAYSYGNSGYYLLGLIIERFSGVSYGRYMSRHIFAPLGMRRTAYRVHLLRPPRGATRYLSGGSSPRKAPPLSMTIGYSAGGISSTVLDLLRWERGLRMNRVVTRASYLAMTTPLTLRRGGGSRPYGFGLDLNPVDGHQTVSHSGGGPGLAAELMWFPRDGLAVAVLANSDTVSAWNVGAAVAAVFLR